MHAHICTHAHTHKDCSRSIHVQDALRAALGDVVDHRPAGAKPPPRGKAAWVTPEGGRPKRGSGRGSGEGQEALLAEDLALASWQRGAAAGGVAAAYAAAAAAPVVWGPVGGAVSLDEDDADAWVEGQ